MKQTIRVNEITIRLPGGARLRPDDLARRVAAQVTQRSGKPVAPGLQQALANRLNLRPEKGS